MGVKYGLTASQASKHYRAAVQRLLEVVTALDGKDCIRDFEPWKKMVEERSGSFPIGVKWYLLNKLLGMRPAEISRLEGVKHPSAVRGMIIRVSDQLRGGEISLFEADDPEKAEAAKDRLEAQRKKRRERYPKKKRQKQKEALEKEVP